MSKFIVEKQIKGTIAENLAKNYFLNKGFLVFPSLTAQGCIDMVVINENNKMLKVDVKCVSRRKRDNHKVNRSRTPLQDELDVKILYVDTDRKECYFYKKDKNHLKRRTKVEKMK